MAKKTPKLVKKLRYVLRTVVELEAADAGEVTDIIERNRELGTCEVEDVSVVERQAE